ncbi:hypothetical protein ACFOW6_14185 [Fodinicurvata halophila]|uniref:PD(D/E)XK endonuclease domain-containing protein n=1 Tax=Fodinicurvata halophila TaxID=1419723 RepID=A0ABV8UQ39_9PROT
MADESHFLSSSLREKIVEHVFVGDLLRSLWLQEAEGIEVLRAEVDDAGYDLVLEANGVLRHVQLKASSRTAKTRQVNIHTALSKKPSGCVIWISVDPETLDLGPYLWFGGSPGQPLPPLGEHIAKHAKANSRGEKAMRTNIRILRRSEFREFSTISEVTEALFGSASF